MKKKQMIPLTYQENKFYKKQNICYICKKELNIDKNDGKAFFFYVKHLQSLMT